MPGYDFSELGFSLSVPTCLRIVTDGQHPQIGRSGGGEYAPKIVITSGNGLYLIGNIPN